MNEARQIVVFDTEEAHVNLLPLSFTRTVCEFRVGITTIIEKWMAFLPGNYSQLTVEELSAKYPHPHGLQDDALFVAGNVIPDAPLCAEISSLKPGDALFSRDDRIIAFRGKLTDLEASVFKHKEIVEHCRMLRYVFDVFLLNGDLIREDFKRLTAGRKSAPLPDDCRAIGPMLDENGLPTIFIEDGAKLYCATLNTKDGPIYIGRDTTIMEGSCLRGPLCVGDRTKIRMGSKIYCNTTFGPCCRIGGEIDNTVFFGYSNKAHDGYLGNAVIGEWCNIGAGTNASNLKNDYAKIRIWNYATGTFMKTDLQFCGLIMGDHSKAGINCMFNTATVVGVGVNVHGSGFPRVLIPSFTEGSPQTGFSVVPLKKFYDIADRVMARRDRTLSEAERGVFEKIHADTHK